MDCPYLADGRYILDLQGNVIAKIPEGITLSGVSGKPFKQYFTVKKDGKKGLMDKSGNMVLEPVYDDISGGPNALGLFLVQKDYQIMYVDRNGTAVQSINYGGSTSDIRGWSSGSPILVFDSMGSKLIFTAAAGLLPQSFMGEYSMYPNAGLFLEITWKSEEGYKHGIMDVNGNMLVPFTKETVEVNAHGTLVLVGKVLYRIRTEYN